MLKLKYTENENKTKMRKKGYKTKKKKQIKTKTANRYSLKGGKKNINICSSFLFLRMTHANFY